MKKGGRTNTPVSFKGSSVAPHQFQSFMTEWSLTQAEANHVETIDEANDFSIHDEEDNDFFNDLTVYEMHDQAEENLQLYNESLPPKEEEPEFQEEEKTDPPEADPPAVSPTAE